jgi:hypothetical protein
VREVDLAGVGRIRPHAILARRHIPIRPKPRVDRGRNRDPDGP